MPSTSAIRVAQRRSLDREEEGVAYIRVVERNREPFRRPVLDRPRLRDVVVERVEPDHDEREVDEHEHEPRTEAQQPPGQRDPRPLQVLERPGAARQEQVDDHDRDRHERIGRGERQVVGDADVVVDHVADELGARDDLRRDVVTEREREREDRAGDERREDERQHDPEERAARLARPGRPRPRAASSGSARARRTAAGSCTAARGT